MGVEYSEQKGLFVKRNYDEVWKEVSAEIISIMHTVVCIGGPAHLSRVSWPPEQSPEQAFRVALCNCSKVAGALIHYSGPGMKSMLYTYRPERDGPMMHYFLVHEDGENYYLYGPMENGWWWCAQCVKDVNEPCNHK